MTKMILVSILTVLASVVLAWGQVGSSNEPVLIRLQVQSRIPVGKIQALKEALQLQFSNIKDLKEREIAVGLYSFEGKTAGSLEQLKKTAEAFLFESMPVKSVVVEDNNNLLIKF